MQQAFIENIKINKVRHLKDINVPVCKERRKHIIFTGKNGSGKTSVLDAIAAFLSLITSEKSQFEAGKFVVAYYEADRIFEAYEPKHVAKVCLKECLTFE